jgi:hypothetical protein
MRFLGCYAAYVGLASTFRDYVSVASSRVKQSEKKAQRTKAQVSIEENERRWVFILLDSLTLEDGTEP